MGLAKGDLLEGRYRIFSKIGQGGMGVVYAAEHVALHKKCAIKVLHPSEAQDQTMIARFRIEAQAAANIRHPNIVEVMDFGITPDNRPFFVMEYLEGESLADRLDRKGRFSERTAVNITAQILSGLQAAHRVRVVHRDLKPENIFLARIGDGREIVKILDFGISKIVAGTPSRPPAPISGNHQVLTQKGIVFGTPGYMAPEALFGTENIDSRADLFAVSVLLFEMLIGKRPFHGPDPHATMLATASVPAPSVLSFQKGLSTGIDDVITRGLSKEPKYRFQTAESFLNALDRVRKTPKRPVLDTESKHPVNKSSERENRQAPPSRLELASLPPTPHRSKESHHRDYEREIAMLRKDKKRSQVRRRISFALSPLTFLFLTGVGAGVYYYFVRKPPVHVISNEDPIDARIAGKVDIDDVDTLSDHPAMLVPTETITIKLISNPEDLTVHWAGKPVFERPLIVPKGTDPVDVRFTKPGYSSEKRRVVPDQEQTIVIRLKRLKAPKK